jgi:N-acetylglucosaminyldiphosphoundecaprenol N-acetyl-beta-D-mannosaminyltransferase
MRNAVQHQEFLGVSFTPLTLSQALSAIRGRDAAEPFAFVVTPNAHHLVAARKGERRFSEPQAAAWLVLNDSRILHLLARWMFGRDLPQAAGSDLTSALFDAGIPADAPITMIGGDDEIERRLSDDFGLRRIARYNPPMGFWRDEAQMDLCIDFVRAHPARYVFFVCGAPQSEVLAMRCGQISGITGTGLCVGSSLNFVTGVVKRAPRLIRQAGLEGLWRLGLNPTGHFKRVFVDSLPVLWIALADRMSSRVR